MKPNIHPTWYPQAKFTCACGNTILTGATVPELRVEICSACHPFFTGKMKFVDTKGQVQRFQEKQQFAKAAQAKIAGKTKKRKGVGAPSVKPQTLKDMLKKTKVKAV